MCAVDLSAINKKYYKEFKKLGWENKKETQDYLLSLNSAEFNEELSKKYDFGKNCFQEQEDIYESNEERAVSYMLYKMCLEIESWMQRKYNDDSIYLVLNPQQPVQKYVTLRSSDLDEFDWEDYEDKNRWRRFDFVIELVKNSLCKNKNISKRDYIPVLFIEVMGPRHFEPENNSNEKIYEHKKLQLNDKFKEGISECLGIELCGINVCNWKEKYFNKQDYRKTLYNDFARELKSKIKKGIDNELT